MAIKVVMAGATGWVGRAMIPAISAQGDMALAGAVARNAAGQDSGTALGLAPNGVDRFGDAGRGAGAPSDVVVDYTKPDVVKQNTLARDRQGAACGDRHVGPGRCRLCRDRRGGEGQGVGVLAAGNFSITATLMKRFALMAAKYVPDVEIIDYASAKKPDAPSGTARELAEALAEVRGASTARPVAEVLGVPGTRGAAVGAGAGVQVHALRLPSYILSCEALFGLPDERLTIRHDAGSSAAPYVAGTLLAIRRVADFKGLVRGLDALME